MFYSSIFYADWIVSNNLDINLIQSGIHVIINYDKYVLDKTAYKDCFYSIGQTKRGADHVRILANGWRRLVSKYNRHAYVHIERKEFIDNIPYSLDETGNFLPYDYYK